MSASSNALSKTLSKRSMEEKVLTISQILQLESENLWRLSGLYSGSSLALMTAEANKSGAANAFLDALYYALTTTDETLNLDRLQKFHSLLYRLDENKKPGLLRSEDYYNSIQSKSIPYFTRNPRIRKNWHDLTNTRCNTWHCPIPNPQYFIDCFSEYSRQITAAKTPKVKLETIISFIYALGLAKPFTTRIIDPLTILFIQLLHVNHLDLRYLINLDLCLETDSLDHVLELIGNYQPFSNQSFDLSAESKLWEAADTEKNRKGFIHWSVSSTSPLHQSFFNELIKRYPDSINSLDEFNNTPLINACFRNNGMAVQRLLEQPEININQKGQNGFTAYDWAEKMEQLDIIELLKPGIDSSIESEKPKKNPMQTLWTSPRFGLLQPFKKQEFCRGILLRHGNGATTALDALEQAQRWVTLETLRQLNPNDELLKRFENVSLDLKSNPFYFKQAAVNIVKYRKLAQNLPNRPAIIDSIFDNYDFFCATDPKKYAPAVDLSHYDSTQHLYYLRFINLVIYKYESHCFLEKDSIAPEIYELFFNELFSSNHANMIQSVIDRLIYPRTENKVAFIHYLTRASNQQLIIFFQYIIKTIEVERRLKNAFDEFISHNERIGCSFLNYLLTLPANPNRYTTYTAIHSIVYMKSDHLKLLVDLAINHFKQPEIDVIIATLLTQRKQTYSCFSAAKFEQLLSDPRIIGCIASFLSRNPDYISHLDFNIRDEALLSSLLLSHLNTFSLHSRNGTLSPEACKYLLYILSWKKKTYPFYTGIFERIERKSLVNYGRKNSQQKRVIAGEQGSVALSFFLFLMSDEAIDKYKMNSSVMSYLSKEDTLRKLSQVVIYQSEANLIPSFLKLLVNIFDNDAYKMKKLLAIYIQTKLSRFPEETGDNARTEFYVAIMSSSSFFAYQGVRGALKPKEIENIYETIVLKQNDAFQRKILKELIFNLSITYCPNNAEKYFKSMINHPVFYDMLIKQFSIEPLSSSLIEFIKCRDFTQTLCNRLFSDTCILPDQLKLTAFFNVHKDLISTYYPFFQPKLKTDSQLHHQFMSHLFTDRYFLPIFLSRDAVKNKPAFLLSYLKWIKENHTNYFIERTEHDFPEELIEGITRILNANDKIKLVTMINECDEPEFKAWIDESPALVEHFESILRYQPTIGPCSSGMRGR